MTQEELSDIYYINKEIEKLQTELYNLKHNNNFISRQQLSNMPKGEKATDIFVDYAEAKKTIEDMINYNLRKLQEKRIEIEDYLRTIKDGEVRLIIRLRCINNMKWEDIGKELNMDRKTASRKFYNFFKVAHNVT